MKPGKLSHPQNPILGAIGEGSIYHLQWKESWIFCPSNHRPCLHRGSRWHRHLLHSHGHWNRCHWCHEDDSYARRQPHPRRHQRNAGCLRKGRRDCDLPRLLDLFSAIGRLPLQRVLEFVLDEERQVHSRKGMGVRAVACDLWRRGPRDLAGPRCLHKMRLDLDAHCDDCCSF